MPKRRKDSPTAAPWTEIPLGDDLFGETPQADFTQLSEEFFYTLPSGYVVPCLDTAEYDLAIRTAKPYVEGEAGIQSEEWVHIAHFVQNVVLRDRTMRELSKPGADRNMARLKELRTLLGKLDDQIQQFTTKRIDPLRAARGDEGESVADWRKRLEEKGLAYAERHIGEHTWRAFCPEPTCPHHVTPFTVLQERAHWATDPASGPDKIWNEEIGELVHLNYCTQENCDHVAHRHRYNGTLSVEDGARILRISAIGLIQVAMERNFDLGIVADLDRPESLLPYVR